MTHIDINSLSIKELKELIVRFGKTYKDCLEKDALQERAREALSLHRQAGKDLTKPQALDDEEAFAMPAYQNSQNSSSGSEDPVPPLIRRSLEQLLPKLMFEGRLQGQVTHSQVRQMVADVMKIQVDRLTEYKEFIKGEAARQLVELRHLDKQQMKAAKKRQREEAAQWQRNIDAAASSGAEVRATEQGGSSALPVKVASSPSRRLDTSLLESLVSLIDSEIIASGEAASSRAEVAAAEQGEESLVSLIDSEIIASGEAASSRAEVAATEQGEEASPQQLEGGDEVTDNEGIVIPEGQQCTLNPMHGQCIQYHGHNGACTYASLARNDRPRNLPNPRASWGEDGNKSYNGA